MQKISLIAAIDAQRGLGYKGQLLCHLPADLQYFKAKTLGKPIIMGRKTFESIGKALPLRRNIVITRQLMAERLSLHSADIQCVTSFDKALAVALDAPEVMIIGGASIYEQALPLATDLYLTHIHQIFPADVFFPSINPDVWNMVSSDFYPHDEKNPYDMTFKHFQRQSLAEKEKAK